MHLVPTNAITRAEYYALQSCSPAVLQPYLLSCTTVLVCFMTIPVLHELSRNDTLCSLQEIRQ